MDRPDYVLMRGRSRPIALLQEIERDQPTVRCELLAFASFEAVRQLLRADRGADTWTAFLRTRLLRLWLHPTDGSPTIGRLRLTVDGNRASFRFAAGPMYRWRFRRWAAKRRETMGPV